MNINPVLLAIMCFVCTWLGYLKGKSDTAKTALNMALDLSNVLDLHIAPIETTAMPFRKH